MQRYAHLSKWVSLAAFMVLVASCFMTWTHHADIGMDFTAFFSQKNMYGKPGKFLLFMALISTICSFLSLLWLKRLALFCTAMNLAYAVKSFILFSSCYGGYCPEKRIGIWLMMLSVIFLFLAAIFPQGKVNAQRAEAS
jgi:hypothetical protein